MREFLNVMMFLPVSIIAEMIGLPIGQTVGLIGVAVVYNILGFLEGRLE